MRPGPAPNAARMASSRRRAPARARDEEDEPGGPRDHAAHFVGENTEAPQRAHLHAPAEVALRMLCREAARDRPQIGLRRGE